MTAPAIRPERAADAGAIRALLIASFSGHGEADLVEALRRDGELLVSLVATEGGAILGHAGASPLTIEHPARRLALAALAPVAVAPGRQRCGIGSALVRAVLQALAARGIDLVLVLGDPAWYRRFGFSAAAAAGLRAPFAGPHLTALDLTEGAAAAAAGSRIGYASAFAPFLPQP